MTKPEKTWNVYSSINETGYYFVDTAMGFCTVDDFVEQKDAYVHHALFYSEQDLAPLVSQGTYTFDGLIGLVGNSPK